MDRSIAIRCGGLSRLGYGLGESAHSLLANSLFAFAMLFSTEALGLDPRLAAFALAASVLWEIVLDPWMGHLSDRTRSRFGRRHPWMLLGGILMAVAFHFFWSPPPVLLSRPRALFGYLVGMNLALRTGLIMFAIPYLALGFEGGADSEGRARLQAVRLIFNMAANLVGPALAWSLFFGDVLSGGGPASPGTSLPSAYARMGAVFAPAAFGLALVAIGMTRRAIEDSRSEAAAVPSIRRRLRDELSEAMCDVSARRVVAFIFPAHFGMVIVSSLQMYTYIHFMRFAPAAKSVVHGMTMVGMALGAMQAVRLARMWGKPRAVRFGTMLSLSSGAVLAALGLSGMVEGGGLVGAAGFAVLHAAYWLGSGIVLPTATSMMADAAEARRERAGLRREGIYSALFSMTQRTSMAGGLMASGLLLHALGFASGGVRSSAAPTLLFAAMCLAGPALQAAALRFSRIDGRPR